MEKRCITGDTERCAGSPAVCLLLHLSLSLCCISSHSHLPVFSWRWAVFQAHEWKKNPLTLPNLWLPWVIACLQQHASCIHLHKGYKDVNTAQKFSVKGATKCSELDSDLQRPGGHRVNEVFMRSFTLTEGHPPITVVTQTFSKGPEWALFSQWIWRSDSAAVCVMLALLTAEGLWHHRIV